MCKSFMGNFKNFLLKDFKQHLNKNGIIIYYAHG